jgi:hypothetical protein
VGVSRMILETPPPGHHHRSFSSVKFMPHFWWTATVRTVYLPSLRLERGIVVVTTRRSGFRNNRRPVLSSFHNSVHRHHYRGLRPAYRDGNRESQEENAPKYPLAQVHGVAWCDPPQSSGTSPGLLALTVGVQIPVIAPQHNQTMFRFRHAAFYFQLKSKVGNILAKVTALRITTLTYSQHLTKYEG